jgi:hypothetical protein
MGNMSSERNESFYYKYNSLSRQWLSNTRLETVLSSSSNVLQVLHTTSTGGVSSLSLQSPVVRSQLSSWVTTRSTGLLLDVERTTTTSVTQSVGLVVTLTERWSTLCCSMLVAECDSIVVCEAEFMTGFC